MKITVLQSDLSSKLNIVSRFTSSRASLPILSNILLRVTGSKLVIQATNLEMSISTQIGAQVEASGEITLAAKTFSDLVQSFGNNKIVIEVSGENAKVSSGDSKAILSGINSSDFPIVPDKMEENFISLENKEFKEALTQVLFSASPDETRPALSGVLIVNDSLVTSDGFRLSKKELNLHGSNSTLPKAPLGVRKLILPKNTMNEVSKIIKDNNEKIEFSYKEKENQVLFRIGDYIISSRVVDGEYPNFKKIIPVSSRITVNLSKEDLVSSLKTISVIAREGANIAEFNFSAEGLNIKTQNPKGGIGESHVPAKVVGGSLAISYNYKYLLDFLSVIKSDNVLIELNDSNSPGVFKEVGDESYLHLIMPVRV